MKKEITTPKSAYAGIAFAVLATIVWSGNFIVARGIHEKIPPVTLAFFRWSTASVIVFFLAYKSLLKEWLVVKKHPWYFIIIAVTGVSIFNTLLYVAGHYTSAINLALIGTTASPVFVIIISFLFFKEKVKPLRLAGLLVCIAGIAILLSKGSLSNLANLQFGKGDLLILFAAFGFAWYSILVKKKPEGISSITFLFVSFVIGTLVLLPFYLYERTYSAPIQWNISLGAIILYLGLGTSVIAFLCWNKAIERIGSVRTALFGNLIPVFASLEAVWILGEEISLTHLIGGSVVIGGILIANTKKANNTNKQ